MTQDTLFPIADLKTEGYAQPEPRAETDVEPAVAESDDSAGAEAA